MIGGEWLEMDISGSGSISTGEEEEVEACMKQPLLVLVCVSVCVCVRWRWGETLCCSVYLREPCFARSAAKHTHAVIYYPGVALSAYP